MPRHGAIQVKRFRSFQRAMCKTKKEIPFLEIILTKGLKDIVFPKVFCIKASEEHDDANLLKEVVEE